MPSLWLNYEISDGCPYQRLLLPARFCAPQFERMGCRVEVGPGLPDGYDWLAMHGIISNYAIQHVGRWHRHGIKFLWSLDDDFLTVPDCNPARPDQNALDNWQLAKELADLILVSTPALANTLRDVRDKLVVAPNLVDVNAFPVVPEEITAVELPVRFVWCGGKTHAGDVALLARVVDRMLKKFGPEKVCFVFMGMAPPHPLLRDWLGKGVMHQPGVPFMQYERVRNTLQPDVWLAPLADDAFNKSKSNLRVLEGWALFSAVVASPVGEYNVVNSGVDGRFASTEDEWVSVLSRLATDHEYRLHLAVEGRKRVEREFDWRKRECRRAWENFYSLLFEVPLPGAD